MTKLRKKIQLHSSLGNSRICPKNASMSSQQLSGNTKPLPEPLLNHCQLEPCGHNSVNRNRPLIIFYPKNTPENVACKMLAILFENLTFPPSTHLLKPWSLVYPMYHTALDYSPCHLHTQPQYRSDSKFAPSQWETALLCNNISHWLGTKLESALPISTWRRPSGLCMGCQWTTDMMTWKHFFHFTKE